MSEEDDEISELWDDVEGRSNDNSWIQKQALAAMTKLQIEHGQDTTKLVLSMMDEWPWLVAKHFREMFDRQDLYQTAKEHFEKLKFDPKMQPHVIHELHNFCFSAFGRTEENAERRQWAIDLLVEMFVFFRRLKVDGKCKVADAIIDRGEYESLGQLFRLTRKAKSEKILKKTAVALYLLDQKFPIPHDPSYYHQKLLQMSYTTVNGHIRYWQQASILNQQSEEESIRLRAACEILTGYWAASWKFFAFERVAQLFGSTEDNCQPVGVLALNKLGRTIPLQYFIKVLNLENFPQRHHNWWTGPEGRVIKEVVKILPPTLEYLPLFQQIVLSDLPPSIRASTIRSMLEIPELSLETVQEILAKIEDPTGRITSALNHHLNG